MRQLRVTFFVVTMVTATGWAAACNPFSPDDSRSSPRPSTDETADAGADASVNAASDAEAEAEVDGTTGEPTTCTPGTFVTKTSSTDRTCEPCAAETYSNSTNATNCTPWTVCGSNEVERTPGTSTSDRTCIVAPWTRQFGTNTDDTANSVSVDGSGSIYVAGSTGGKLPSQNGVGGGPIFVRKYDGSGKELWTHQVGSTEAPASLVNVDGSGNVYVAGTTNGTLPGQTNAGKNDVFVRKYDSSGKELWTRQFGSPSNDEANDMGLDGSGNVYVAGNTFGALPNQINSGGIDAFVRKYVSSGKELWTRQFGSKASTYGLSVTMDGNENVYVAGTTSMALPGQTRVGGWDAFVRKYDGSGTEIWTRQFGSTGSDSANAVRVDGGGNLLVAGDTDGVLPNQVAVGSKDAAVWKCDGSGNILWARQFGSPDIDHATAVTFDKSGNVLVVGTVDEQHTPDSADIFVLKYDGSGKEVWKHQVGSSMEDHPSSVNVDENGTVFVAGYTAGALPGQTSAGGVDAFVLRMNP